MASWRRTRRGARGLRARFSVALGVPSLPTVTPNPTPLDSAPEASDPRSRGEGQAERQRSGRRGRQGRKGFWTDYPLATRMMTAVFAQPIEIRAAHKAEMRDWEK